MAHSVAIQTRGILVFTLTCSLDQQEDIKKLQQIMSRAIPVSLHWGEHRNNSKTFTTAKFWIDTNSLSPSQRSNFVYLKEMAAQTRDFLLGKCTCPDHSLLCTAQGKRSFTLESKFVRTLNKLCKNIDFSCLVNSMRLQVYLHEDNPKSALPDFTSLYLAVESVVPKGLTCRILGTKRSVLVTGLDDFFTNITLLLSKEVCLQSDDLAWPYEDGMDSLLLTEKGREKIAIRIEQSKAVRASKREQLALAL